MCRAIPTGPKITNDVPLFENIRLSYIYIHVYHSPLYKKEYGIFESLYFRCDNYIDFSLVNDQRLVISRLYLFILGKSVKLTIVFYFMKLLDTKNDQRSKLQVPYH